MRTIHVRLLSLGVAAMLAVSVSAEAQTKSSAILNAAEVRQLINSTNPADQARLSSHFAALADEYTAEAKRHASMAQPIGNPSRNLGTALSAHCKRLAELNTQSAAAVRELAVHHQKLANGQPSTAPADPAGFQSGAGARKPNASDLDKLAETANTAADHRDLSAYFLDLAKRYSTDAANHAAYAKAYRGLPRGDNTAMATHCDRLARLLRDASKEASEAAAEHNDMAGSAR